MDGIQKMVKAVSFRGSSGFIALTAMMGILLIGEKEVRSVDGFKIISASFKESAAIDKKYTCEGTDLSPSLAWSNPPAGTKSFALICDDPDAPMGDWVHWLAYNIPADVKALEEGVSSEELRSLKIAQGQNDFGKLKYGGPCPPPGKSHRYYFKLYALKEATHFSEGLTKQELLAKIKPLVLSKVEIMGTYKR